MWLAARYEDEYVKVNGEWKCQHLKVFSSFMTPYEQGWVKKKFTQEACILPGRMSKAVLSF